MGMIPPEQWASAWSEHPSTTEQQATGAERDLEAWLDGAPHDSFDAFRKLLTPILSKFLTMLEIGAGCGIYCPILKHIDENKHYTGCDISEHMVDYANKKWGPMFWKADSANLPDKDGRFDLVCISGLIQHLADYRPSIKEAARVAKRWVILHRVECTNGKNHEFIRKAYDSEIPTRVVNEDEVAFFCGLQKLRLEKAVRWSMSPNRWNASFLFEKV